MRLLFKRMLSFVIVMLMFFSVVTVAVEAASVSVTDSNYGYMVPTNGTYGKVLSTVNLYGSHDYLNFYIKSERNDVYFFYEIFLDETCTRLVTADYVYCNRGEYNYSPLVQLKGVFKSGTYYCVAYAATVVSDDIYVSSESMVSFKIVVDRTTDFSKQVVVLKNITNTVNGPKITWYKHSSIANKYAIYRRSVNGTKWTRVATVGASTLTFTDESVKDKNGKYVYTVKAYNKAGTASRYQFSGLTSLYAKTPVVKNVSTLSDNRVRITWDETSTSAYYRIYRKTNGGSWQILQKSYRGTSFIDRTAVSGNNYEYTVRAFINTAQGVAASSYYSGNSVDYVASPELLQIIAVDCGLQLTWKEVAGAIEYTIYRRLFESGEGWVNIGRVTKDTFVFVDETADVNGVYSYTVRAEGPTSRGSYTSKGIEYVVLRNPSFTLTINEDSYTLNCSKVPFATIYKLYKKGPNGNWLEVGQSASGYLHVTGSGVSNRLTDNKFGEIEFAVSAVRGTIESDYKNNIKTIFYTPKTSTYCSVYTDYNLVSWSNTSMGVYNLYKKDKGADDSEYKLIYSGSAKSFKDTDVEYGVGYTYVAKAIYNDVEQSERLNATEMVRYDPQKYINSFNVTKRDSYGTEFFNISYDLTEVAEEMNVSVFCLAGSAKYPYWDYVDMGYPAIDHTRPATEEAQLAIVVSDEIGSTPMDAFISIVKNDKCAKPQVKYRAVKGGIEIFWDAVEGADSYILRTINNSDFRKEIKSDGSSTYCVFINNEEYNETLKKDNKYVEVTLDAVHSNGNLTVGEEYTIGYNSEPPKMIMVCETSEGVAVCFGEEHISGTYVVFRKAPGETSWKKIGKITRYGGDSLDYVDKTAEEGVKYTYTVRKYNGGTGCYTSYYDTNGMTVGKIITPKLTAIKNTPYGVSVQCEEIRASRFCVNYHLYRRTENGKWEKVGASIATEGYAHNGVTDKTAKTGVKYYYTVISTYCSAKSSYDPEGVSIVCVQTPALKSATRSSTGITVKWSEVTGADGYYVYRKTASSGWSKVGTVKKGSTVSFNDTTAKSGTTYYYTVKAYSGSSTSGYVKNGIKCS